jgi:hypothetical protein
MYLLEAIKLSTLVGRAVTSSIRIASLVPMLAFLRVGFQNQPTIHTPSQAVLFDYYSVFTSMAGCVNIFL